MGIIENERKGVIESGSPLRNHSLNQRKIREMVEGANRMRPPRKELRAAERRERRLRGICEYKRQKLDRIFGRIERVLEGDDEIDTERLRREIDFINRHGISVEICNGKSQLI